MDLGLHDKVAIVTGAMQGIGRATVLGLASEGAKVTFCDTKEEGAEKVLSKIENLGTESIFEKTDVTDLDQVKRMVNKVVNKFGKVDILVNNAGTFHSLSFHESTPENWHMDIDVSLYGALNCCRAVIEHMMKQKSGRIVNVASLSAMYMAPRLTAYACAKSGMVGLTRSLAADYGRYGIGVNAVWPGNTAATGITTDILHQEEESERKLEPAALEERKRWQRAYFPMGKWLQPEDIASVIVLPSSPRALKFVTGQSIIVDGGHTIIA